MINRPSLQIGQDERFGTVAVYQVLPNGHRVPAIGSASMNSLNGSQALADGVEATGRPRPQDHFRVQDRWTPRWPVLDGRVPNLLEVGRECQQPLNRSRQFLHHAFLCGIAGIPHSARSVLNVDTSTYQAIESAKC